MKLDKTISEGKGIFVFSDPAGANSVLSIIDYLVKIGKKNQQDFLVYTDKFGIYPDQYKDIVKKIDFEERICSKIHKSFKPNFIFTSTSNNNFEHLWRTYFFQKIKIFSFIDHWTNFLNRFTFEGKVCFGNEIWVIDNKAKEKAIIEGIPASLIKVKGNPYYYKVNNFSPNTSKTDFFKKYELDIKKKLILFISDDIKLNFKTNSLKKCILGYDEYSILESILEALHNLDKRQNLDFNNYQLLVKLHPKSDIKKFDYLLDKYDNIIFSVLQKCDPLLINYYSDYVIGMFSNMVIESFLMNKRLLRIQLGHIGDDLIMINGLRDKYVNNKQNLLEQLKTFLN